MDTAAEANSHFRTTDRRLAIQLAHAGCQFAKDGEGPVMNSYTANGLRAMGLLERDKGATLTEFEQAAMEAVKRKKPGQLIYIFERDLILETYLRRRQELTKTKNECARQGVKMTYPLFTRTVREIAEEDFCRDETTALIDGSLVWLRGAWCSTGRVEFTEASLAEVASGQVAQGSARLVGTGGGNPKRWPLSLSNERRAELGIPPKP